MAGLEWSPDTPVYTASGAAVHRLVTITGCPVPPPFSSRDRHSEGGHRHSDGGAPPDFSKEDRFQGLGCDGHRHPYGGATAMPCLVTNG